MSAATASPDVLVSNHGSVVGFVFMSPAAQDWRDESMAWEPWQVMGGAIMVDHRMAQAILAGLADAGLSLGEE